MTVRLSLAVAAARTDRAELDRFLATVHRAGLQGDDEVIVALSPRDPSDLVAIEAAFAGGGQVWFSIREPNLSLFRLWGIAMAQARGTHVAALDVRDALGEGWAEAWAEAPRDRIACGPVDPDRLENCASWACYFSEYGQFLSPLERVEEVPGNNVVFPRNLLPPSDELASKGFMKTFHLAALERKMGALPIVVVPQMVVRFRREYQLLPYLYRRFLHGRCYGARRLEQSNAPPRSLCLAFAPLLPILRVQRVLARMLHKPRRPAAFANSLPSLILGEITWAAGEGFGYASGAGDACERVF